MYIKYTFMANEFKRYNVIHMSNTKSNEMFVAIQFILLADFRFLRLTKENGLML
jgi:hypothetical protein